MMRVESNEPKILIYLDQFVISNITKALDVASKGHARARQDPFWLAAYRQLDRLRRLQLIVCPDSFFHRDESLLSGDPSFEVLTDLYEYLSNGCTFQDYNSILRQQLCRHLANYLDGRPSEEPVIAADRIVMGRPNEWMGRLRVSVPWRPRQGEADETRSLRDKQYESLRKVFEQWRTEEEISFEASVAKETAAFGRATLEAYARFLRRYFIEVPAERDEQMKRTGKYEPRIEDILPPPAAQLIHDMFRTLEGFDLRNAAALRAIFEYFASPYLVRVHYLRLSAMLYASLARKVRAGRRKLFNKGTVTDVNAIASLLPYCRAMFIDSEMAGYLGERPLSEEVVRYGTEVFSPNSKAAFLAFLTQIETQANPMHLRMVQHVYGDKWLQPYMNVIADCRAQRLRRQQDKS